jgi:hypothetical protein
MPSLDPSSVRATDGAIVFRRKGLKIGEVYFRSTRPEGLRRVDLVRFISAPTPPPRKRAPSDLHSLTIDLTPDEDRLFEGVDGESRRLIRRSTDRDLVRAVTFDAPSEETIAEFADAYDRFAAMQALAPCFRPRLRVLAAAQSLVLSAARTEDGRTLVWHAYVGFGTRVQMLHTASTLHEAGANDERNLIGRANRLLHWQDMRHFKERGFAVLDLGGIDVTGRSEKTTQIARFKRSFGGEAVPVHSWTEPRSLKGALALAALRLRGNDF